MRGDIREAKERPHLDSRSWQGRDNGSLKCRKAKSLHDLTGELCNLLSAWLVSASIFGDITWLANVDGIVLPLFNPGSVICSTQGSEVGLHRSDEKEVGLGILEGLIELIPFPLAFRSDRLVLSDSLDGNALLAFGEPPGISLGVGHQVKNSQRKYKAQ